MLSPPIEAYPPTNVIQKFAATQLWQIFKLSLPIIIWGVRNHAFALHPYISNNLAKTSTNMPDSLL